MGHMIVNLSKRLRVVCGAGVNGLQESEKRQPLYQVCKECLLLDSPQVDRHLRGEYAEQGLL